MIPSAPFVVAALRAGGRLPLVGVAAVGPFRSAALVATVVVLAAAGVVFEVLRAPGPNRVIVLVQRYTAWPFLALTSAPVLLAGLWLAPAATWLALGVAVWATVVVGVAAGWSVATVGRAVRRCRIRATWPSVARSANLGVRHDRRSRAWPGGVTSSTLGSEVVEHLPCIRCGRALPAGAGVAYRLRPARGGTVGDVAKASPALAAALGVHRVNVEQLRPSRGRLVVLYRDVLTGAGS